jgi:hypothetical protein
MNTMTAIFRSRPRWFVYLPMIAHVVLTLGIGFLFVIPRSCIAGVNALTIGFLAANAGFVFAYVAGVRLARQQGTRTRA